MLNLEQVHFNMESPFKNNFKGGVQWSGILILYDGKCNCNGHFFFQIMISQSAGGLSSESVHG